MAKYRQLYTEFWSDSFVLELTPEEKYFYLYLMTNTKTTQCGIYEISKKTIETDSGYNRETVEKLIKRFCEYKKILYCEETKELMIINWIKYNLPNNLNIIKCVQREILKVKHIEFVEILFGKCQMAGLDVEKIFENYIVEETFDSESTSDSVSLDSSLEKVEVTEETNEFQINKPLSRDLQEHCKGLRSNRIRSNKEEIRINKQKVRSKEEVRIKNKNNSATDTEELKNIIKIFEENVHAITPLEYEKILEFTNHVTSEVIIMAIEEAVSYNAKTMKYISKILNSWMSNGIKTAEEVKAYQKKWTNKKKNSLNQNLKKGGFCDFEQRTYDYDALEKRLLGYVDTEDLE
ncbi:MAG: DnaD domain-containing protein [Clostridium sp.]|uniref:DnaD domain-containing protein n=1 Tax=Clostridium sp. TaxID=1506 RepID=UPI003D6C7BE8